MLKDKTNLNELHQKAKEIEEQISTLSDMKSVLYTHILALEKDEYQEVFKKWSVSEGSCLVLITKELTGYHSSLVKTWKITEVDTKHLYIDAVVSDYYEFDYQYGCRILSERINFSSLASILEKFDVYVITQEQLKEILFSMHSLNITYQNYKLFKNKIQDLCSKRIS